MSRSVGGGVSEGVILTQNICPNFANLKIIMRLTGSLCVCLSFLTIVACQQKSQEGQKDILNFERVDSITKAFTLEQDAFFNRVATKHFKEGAFSNFKIEIGRAHV